MRIIIFLFILLVLTACEIKEVSVQVVKNILPSETNKAPEFYFCPKDNCSNALVSTMQKAKKSLHCSFFDLDLPQAIKVLKSKSEVLDVKVVVDNLYYDELSNLSFVRKDTSSQYSHNKFCIIDDNIVITGSMNPTKNGAFKNNNNLIILHSKYLAVNYNDEFDELWQGNFGKGGLVRYPEVRLNNFSIENKFCPEDDCSGKVKDEIRKAKESIHFMTFSFTHIGIANAIILQNKTTMGLFEKQQKSKYSRHDLLKYQGFDVKYDSYGGKMHHKVFIIDNSTVITGSFNPSKSGDTRNDENILVFHNSDIAQLYLKEFYNLWNYTK